MTPTAEEIRRELGASRARVAGEDPRYLFTEFRLLFLIVPVFLWAYRTFLSSLLIPGVVFIAVCCLVVLIRDPTFDRNRLWNASELGAGLREPLCIFAVGAVPLLLLAWAPRPSSFLAFPRASTDRWLMIMLIYPALSVYPQEIIFRTFLFHRYRSLFTSARSRVGWSTAAFGAAHLFLGNWIAVILSAIGGCLFARTYERTGSTLQASLEHALWGSYLFTIGLGGYFLFTA